MFNTIRPTLANRTRIVAPTTNRLSSEPCGACFYCGHSMVCHNPVLRTELSRRTGKTQESLEVTEYGDATSYGSGISDESEMFGNMADLDSDSFFNE